MLADETVRLLAPRSGEIYCDATVGGGGHAERILEASAPDGTAGRDRPRSGGAGGGQRVRLARFGDRVTLVHGAFGDARRISPSWALAPVDGFVLDLGVSSPQLDRAERGFSFQQARGRSTCGWIRRTARPPRELLGRIGVDELEADPRGIRRGALRRADRPRIKARAGRLDDHQRVWRPWWRARARARACTRKSGHAHFSGAAHRRQRRAGTAGAVPGGVSRCFAPAGGSS